MAITEQRSEAAADAAYGIGPRRHPIAAWLTTTDHKKIGIMYLVNSYFWFGVAGLLAVFIRAPSTSARSATTSCSPCTGPR